MSATLLIMDDEPGIRSALETAFQMEGYSVIAVPDGLAALTCEMPYDAAVLDVDVPLLDGVTVATELLARDPTRPVWLMTGAWREDTLRRAQNLGVAILRKPFKFEHLLAEVSRRLEAARAPAAVWPPRLGKPQPAPRA